MATTKITSIGSPLGNGFQKAAFLILESAGVPSGKTALSEDESAEDGNYLEGAPENVKLFKNYIFCKLHAMPARVKMEDFTSGNSRIPSNVIKEFFKEFKSVPIVIYYTGHGAKDGSWCFTLHSHGGKERVSPSDLVSWYRDATSEQTFKSLSVISQSCYSGSWCQHAEANTDLFTLVLASAKPSQTSFSDESGSEVTKRIFGRVDCSMKSVPLLYSWQHTLNSAGAYHWPFAEFLKIKTLGNSPQVPVCLQVQEDGRHAASFAWQSSMYNGAAVWGSRHDWSKFWQDFLNYRSEGYKIVSMSSNGTKIVFYADKGFATGDQQAVHGSIEYCKTVIEEKWDAGYRITAACPRIGDGWCFVLTKEVSAATWPPAGRDGWAVRNSWSDICAYMQEAQTDGMIVLTICACHGQYLAVMVASDKHQVRSNWSGDIDKAWIESKWNDGYGVTTMFQDPKDKQWKVFMTKGVPGGLWTYNRDV